MPHTAASSSTSHHGAEGFPQSSPPPFYGAATSLGGNAAVKVSSPFGARNTDVDALKADTSRTVSRDGTDLLISTPTTSTRVSQWWLRDHCPCSACTNSATAQRQINLLRGGPRPRIHAAEVSDSSPTISITWADGHTSTYSRAWLLRRNTPAIQALRTGSAPLHLWGSELSSSPPTVPLPSSTESLGPLLSTLRQHGLVFISSVPATPEASETLLSRIGPIRQTHWGGFTVVTADLTSKDTAWTAEALDPHTDNTYFSDPSGLQMLHLLSHAEGSGGESLFVDGFAAAADLARSDPEAYRILATTGVHAHSSGDEGTNIQPSSAMPVLRHDSRGALVQVRWNNADRAGLEAPMEEVEGWYAAATEFQRRLDDERFRFWIQLVPGTPVIFDNWRVMHGRAEFTGKRTVCGGYVNYDDYISRYRSVCHSEEELRAATVSG